jgi:hypothetical protein
VRNATVAAVADGIDPKCRRAERDAETNTFAVKQLEAQLQSGALVSVEPRRTKVRLLPL